jgi:Kef-type K+ transport system membrane component KefB
MMGVGWAMMVATLFIKTDYELFLIVGGLLVSSFSIIMQVITEKKLNKNQVR